VTRRDCVESLAERVPELAEESCAAFSKIPQFTEILLGVPDTISSGQQTSCGGQQANRRECNLSHLASLPLDEPGAREVKVKGEAAGMAARLPEMASAPTGKTMGAETVDLAGDAQRPVIGAAKVARADASQTRYTDELVGEYKCAGDVSADVSNEKIVVVVDAEVFPEDVTET
jgi:hypothetical protein